MKKAWLYCRVAYPSTLELEAQKKLLVSYAESHGFEIAGITAEIGSGLTLSRKGLNSVTQALKDGKANTLVISRLSRIGRNVEEVDIYLEWLKQHGIDLICSNGIVPVTFRELLFTALNQK